MQEVFQHSLHQLFVRLIEQTLDNKVAVPVVHFVVVEVGTFLGAGDQVRFGQAQHAAVFFGVVAFQLWPVGVDIVGGHLNLCGGSVSTFGERKNAATAALVVNLF